MADIHISRGNIVLIHGLWMTPLCWKHWVEYLESRSYNVLNSGWPGVDDRTPQQIRTHPKPMANKGIEEIVDHYASIVQKLPEPPISWAIDLEAYLFRSSSLVAWGPSASVSVQLIQQSTVKISASDFHYCFGNAVSEEESNILYERYSIPSVARVLWQGALDGVVHPKGITHVDFNKRDRAPHLLISGSKDHVVPPSTVEKEYKGYQKGSGLVEYKEFEGRCVSYSHFCPDT